MGNIEEHSKCTTPSSSSSSPQTGSTHSQSSTGKCKYPTYSNILTDDDNRTSSQAQTKRNPGSMEDLHNKCKSVFPTCFEGARIMLSRAVSNHFQISHTINLSSVTPSGYRFNVTYLGSKYYLPNECYPILIGDIDPSGNLNASIVHRYFDGIETKFAAQILPNSTFHGSHLTIHKKGTDYTGSITLANLEPLQPNGIVVLHYLQSITKRLAFGSELAYQHGQRLQNGQMALFSIAARYLGNDYQVSGTLGAAGLHLCYYHQASKQLQIGIQLEINNRMQESVASIGYKIDLIKNDAIFKGHIDSNWLVGGVLEKKLHGLPITIAVSALLNQCKNHFRLGIGAFIG